MIEIDNLTRSYGNKIAVAELSLQVSSGEVFAFLGPNGAGKTTTIKTMVGLLRPSSGNVRIRGIDVEDCPQQANQLVGYVPDQPHLYDKLSGRESLAFIARMYGLTPAETEENIARQIEAFQLEEFVDHLTESYSHGMKQRLVFASAMVHRPRVFIVDEPMVGLDPRSMRLVKDLLRNQAESGATVFMSTHTLSVAEEIADRIGIIDQGRLKFLGTLSQLQDHLSADYSSLEQLYLKITTPENGNGLHTDSETAAQHAGSDDPESEK